MIQQIQSWEMERHENRILKRYRQSHVYCDIIHSSQHMATAKCQSVQFSTVVQSCPVLCDPIYCTHQASLSITSSWNLLKLMSIESVMPSNHFILCHPLLLLPSIYPSIRVFPMSKFFTSRGQSIGVSASASVLPMDIQNWFHLGWTGSISI